MRGAWLDNNDMNSKSIRRVVTVNAVAQAWREFRVMTDFITKVAVRTGNLFPLKADRSSQFDGVKLRGFVDDDGNPKNPFAGKKFEDALIEYHDRQKARKKDQKDRKKKRAANLRKQIEKQAKKKARLEKKQNEARRRKTKERSKKKVPKGEIKRELAGIFMIKSGGEVKVDRNDHLSAETIPKVEIKREVGVSFLARSVKVNDDFVEEEMEKIPHVSGVDEFLEEEKENIPPVSVWIILLKKIRASVVIIPRKRSMTEELSLNLFSTISKY